MMLHWVRGWWLLYCCLLASLPMGLAYAESPKKLLAGEALAAKLVGKWQADLEFEGMQVRGITHLQVDGHFSAAVEYEIEGQTVPWSASGDWRVEGRQIIYTLTESSQPDLIPVGEVIRDQVLHVDQHIFRYQDEDGDVFEEQRIVEPVEGELI